MSNTDAVFGDFTKPRAQEALAALVRAMADEKKVAIARFVARANAAPKVVVLIPSTCQYPSFLFHAGWCRHVRRKGRALALPLVAANSV